MSRDTSIGYQLELDDLALMNSGDPAAFVLDVTAEGSDFGNAEAVREVIDGSLMRDGDYASTTRYANRTVSLQARVTAANAGLLPVGEKAITSRMDRYATLTWRRPSAPASVFDVVRSSSSFLFDDLDEVLRNQWTFQLDFECLPFARSEHSSSLSWTGPTQLNNLAATTGWTFTGGSGAVATAVVPTGFKYLQRTTNGALTFQRDVKVDDFVWLAVGQTSTTPVSAVTVNGVSVAGSSLRVEGAGSFQAVTIPTGAWRGQTVTLKFTVAPAASTGKAELWAFWTRAYPGSYGGSELTPRGIDVIRPLGTARAPFRVDFTVPSGGAFLYTGPDPLRALRKYGAGEAAFAKFSVTDDEGEEITIGDKVYYYGPKDTPYYVGLGATAPQPPALFPNGVWPAALNQVSIPNGSSFVYPSDRQAATSFFPTTGAVTVISSAIGLPGGYQPGAVAHVEHALHPSECGFAVLDTSLNPVPATITWFEHWMHHAAR